MVGNSSRDSEFSSEKSTDSLQTESTREQSGSVTPAGLRRARIRTARGEGEGLKRAGRDPCKEPRPPSQTPCCSTAGMLLVWIAVCCRRLSLSPLWLSLALSIPLSLSWLSSAGGMGRTQ